MATCQRKQPKAGVSVVYCFFIQVDSHKALHAEGLQSMRQKAFPVKFIRNARPTVVEGMHL